MTAADDDSLRASDGRVPGKRGLATRQVLLDCTATLLEDGAYRELKVIDIARAAGTSPATFYQYFADVEEAILVLAQEAAADGHKLIDLATAGPWTGKKAYDTALALVDGFLEFWRSHQSTMRVVDLATAEGDSRFRNIRVRLLNEVAQALAAHVRAAAVQSGTADPVDPMATAGVLVSMLAQVSSHQMGFEFWGIRNADMRTAMARQVHWSLVGRKPPT